MPLSDADKIINLEDLAAFKAKMDESVLHKMGDETVEGVKTFRNTAAGHTAGNTVTDLVVRNPEVVRGTAGSGRSYTRVILADRDGDTEETFAGRLGLFEVQSPKENDTLGEELNLRCYKYSGESADYAKSVGITVGYDINGIPYAMAPAISADRTNSTDIVTRGYMEASEWNWQKTKKAGAVTFKPVPESDLEPVVDFMSTETLPVEGEKGPENPSTITGVSNISISVCGKNLAIPYIQPNFTLDSNGWYEASIDNTSGSSTIYAVVFILPTLVFDTSKQYCAVIESDNCDQYWLFSNNNDTQKPRLYYSGSGFRVEGTNKYKCNLSFNDDPIYRIVRVSGRADPGEIKHFKFRFSILQCSADEVDLNNYVYEKPVINTSLVSLGDTYYGGSLDVATGVMTVTWVSVELDGTETWDAIGNNYNSTTGIGFTKCYPHSLGLQKKAALDVTTNSVCSHFSYLGGFGTTGVIDGSVATPRFYYTNGTDSVNGQARFAVPFSDVADFKAWLAAQKTAGTPVMLTYKIYEPFTVQLTPTQIRSLPALDKYEPRVNTVYTDQQAVQVGYQRYAGGAVKALGTTAARTLPERFADVVNVKDFGAKGDGVTDDTAAFEAAWAVANAIFIPHGTYSVSGLELASANSEKPKIIRGDGAKLVADSICLSQVNWAVVSGLDITVSGSLDIEGMRYCDFTGVTVHGLVRIGKLAHASQSTWSFYWNSFTRCEFLGGLVFQAADSAVYFNSNTFTNCAFRSGEQDAIISFLGFNGSSNSFTGNTFVGCDISYGYAFYIDKTLSSEISDFFDVTIIGGYLDSGTELYYSNSEIIHSLNIIGLRTPASQKLYNSKAGFVPNMLNGTSAGSGKTSIFPVSAVNLLSFSSVKINSGAYFNFDSKPLPYDGSYSFSCVLHDNTGAGLQSLAIKNMTTDTVLHYIVQGTGQVEGFYSCVLAGCSRGDVLRVIFDGVNTNSDVDVISMCLTAGAGVFSAVTIDDALNSTSENPIQNKAVNAALAAIEARLAALEGN